MAIAPTPVAALNRAVAVAETRGPAEALDIVDSLPLNDFYLLHTIRAELLVRLGRTGEALAAYQEASDRAGNETQRSHLERRARLLS